MENTRIIVKPILTEKSLSEAERGEYTFEVAKEANKYQIAGAVKELFKVDVMSVKTRISKGRTRRVLKNRKRATITPFKKATVKVGKEQKIDMFEVKS